jgi:hypothetical protein
LQKGQEVFAREEAVGERGGTRDGGVVEEAAAETLVIGKWPSLALHGSNNKSRVRL